MANKIDGTCYRLFSCGWLIDGTGWGLLSCGQCHLARYMVLAVCCWVAVSHIDDTGCGFELWLAK